MDYFEKYLEKVIQENTTGNFSSLAGSAGAPATGENTPSNYVGTNTPNVKKKKKKKKGILPMQKRLADKTPVPIKKIP
jgi:hypothetical protein